MFLGHAAGNVASRVYTAGTTTRLDTSLPPGQVSVIHTSGHGPRQIEVVYGEGVSEATIRETPKAKSENRETSINVMYCRGANYRAKS